MREITPEIINRQASYTLKLSDLAREFGFNLDPDAYEDVWHNGYAKKDIRGKVNLPEKVTGADIIFPSQVAQALESAERDAYAAAIRNHRIKALEEALLKIDLLGGGAEYQDQDGDMISAKAGITAVEINEANDEIILHITNPEHLLNTLLTGVGMFGPELNAKEVQPDREVLSRIHHLKSYFEVYGERIPSPELSSQYVPSIDEEYLSEEIEHRISELSTEDISEAVKELVLESDVSPKEAIQLAAQLSHKSEVHILQEILKQADEEKTLWSAVKV
jgi:hypothetical protein